MRLEEQLDFIREIDKVKSIFRQNYIGDATRKENDAEHSWHLAVMAFLLQEYANEEVDILHVMKMVLIHDLIEIDAGDSYAYDPEVQKDKREREVACAERIFRILPEEQGRQMRALWDEFEEGTTPEAKYAISMDVLQPVLLNDLSRGRSWIEHGVREEQVLSRLARIRPGSEELFRVAMGILEKAIAEGKILPKDPSVPTVPAE